MTKFPYNPFFTGIDIPDEFFCDRQDETAQMIRLIRNGNNIVLKSPRRIGKSSLIKHLFLQKDIAQNFNTLFVDILGTKNAADFQSELQRSFLKAPFSKGTKLQKHFETLLKSLYIDFGGIDSVSGSVQLPRVGITPSNLPAIPMEELFGFLEKQQKPTLVVFDEFQQIEYYPERMAAMLRKYIQQMNKTRFIFSGSSKHMLTTMFQISNQPFYKSAVPMDLDILQLSSYQDFCEKMFAKGGRTVESSAITFAYYLFGGETYLMQELMKEVFSATRDGDSVDKKTILASLSTLIDRKDGDYREILNRLDNKKERNTLFCIASEGVATKLTSSSMLKKYDLDNASSVQNAIDNLMDEKMPLIDRIAKGTYVLQDRLFELWIASKSGTLEAKFQDAQNRFKLQRAILERLPGLTD